MADVPVWPATSCGERLRAMVASRLARRRRRRIASIALLAALPCTLTAWWPPSAALVWNASASTPRGLYRVFPSANADRGDWVVARLPEELRALAANRQYLPRGVPLVKRVAASNGNRVCAIGKIVTLDGRLLVVRRTSDVQGRPLPRWSGCRTLVANEVLLLGDSAWSFDGRYFGITRSADVIGRAELWWRA